MCFGNKFPCLVFTLLTFTKYTFLELIKWKVLNNTATVNSITYNCSLQTIYKMVAIRVASKKYWKSSRHFPKCSRISTVIITPVAYENAPCKVMSIVIYSCADLFLHSRSYNRLNTNDNFPRTLLHLHYSMSIVELLWSF